MLRLRRQSGSGLASTNFSAGVRRPTPADSGRIFQGQGQGSGRPGVPALALAVEGVYWGRSFRAQALKLFFDRLFSPSATASGEHAIRL